MEQQKIETSKAPKAIGPYSQAKKVGNMVYLSGQIPINPRTGKFVKDKSIENQTRQVMVNLKAVLTAAKTNFSHVVKTTIYLTNLENFNVVNKIYGSYFEDNISPARATVQVAKLPLNASIEIDMIAWIP